jgi:diguanylate cyclase
MSQDVWADTLLPSEGEPPAGALRSPLLDAKVMMVDDEPLMTDLVQALLEDEGYVNFVVCNDPREALDLMHREEPSVLLLDLMMPKMSGFEVLEAVRANKETRYVPVIVLTAASAAEAKLRALRLGATDFLSKPVDGSELVLRVRNALAFSHYNKRLRHFDTVTGLPNAILFDRGIEEVLRNRDLVGGLVALVSLTVPEFRNLSEAADQRFADEFVKTLSRRLLRFAQADELMSDFATGVDRAPRVSRLGLDQFGVLFEGVANVDRVESLTKRLLAVVAQPVSLGVHQMVASAWAGIALSPTDGQTALALRKSAALAASHAGQGNASRYKFASPELNAKSLQRLRLGSALRGAAERDELRVHYQPKIHIESGRINGVEALVRWQHPEHGLMPPGRFIGLAEELGLINVVGEWVMAQACRDVARWTAEGLGALTVSVNISKPQLLAGDLPLVVSRIMASSGLPPHQLELELTESLLMDDVEVSRELMAEIKTLGVSLSIDDFGTGYSSLAYLKSFPLDELKVDKSFVDDLPGSSSDVALVHTIIDLGHRLGMTVIAEGVETAAQLACLKRLGCDSFQGFLFSKAVPEDAFRALLAEENARFGGPSLNLRRVSSV